MDPEVLGSIPSNRTITFKGFTLIAAWRRCEAVPVLRRPAVGWRSVGDNPPPSSSQGEAGAVAEAQTLGSMPEYFGSVRRCRRPHLHNPTRYQLSGLDPRLSLRFAAVGRG